MFVEAKPSIQLHTQVLNALFPLDFMFRENDLRVFEGSPVTWFQQLIIHQTELVLPNAEHNLGTVNIRFCRRRGGMSGHSPWFSALGIFVVDPFFVAGHNTM